MFSTFRRLLKRSKDREVPQATENDSYAEKNVNIKVDRNAASAYIASKLLNRPPSLAPEISRLRRQHRELQRRFKQLPPGRPYVQRTKLITALTKMTEGSRRSAAQPGKNLGRPLTSIDPSWLAARSAQRIRSTKIPSYRGSAPLNTRSVQKSASFEAETSRTIGHAHGETPAANKEEPPVAPFKQAASQHRMRRLRQWSLTHGQDADAVPTEGGGRQDVEAALTEIPQTNTSEAVTSLNGPIEASSSLKDKAWSIMAGLSLETLDKKRGVAALESSTAGVDSSAAIEARGPLMTDNSDRRKTEPLNTSQNVARKPGRGPSDSERDKERQLENGGTKRQKSSLFGRPRTRIGVK